MANLDKLKWLAVDFDGTIAQANDDYTIGEPIIENINKLRECVALDYKIIIHTARHWEDYILIEKWLNKHKVPYKQIICGKVLAHKYIDDRAIKADSDWVKEL